MEKTMEMIRNNVHAILDKYLCGELLRDIESEIMHGIEYDFANQEPEKSFAETNFKDCVNELCLKCGQYREEHKGACDGCRWLKPRRGW